MPDLRSLSCVLYRRVSTEKQADEAFSSLDDQQKACAVLAKRLGVNVEAVYTDDGYSGATIDQRPAMRQLLADCTAAPKPLRAPGLVLVLNDSRWGRFPDPEEATYWRVHLSKLGWTVRFAENDDTDNKSIRALMRAMVSGQATQKREDVKANAKRGMRGSVDRGFWCSQAPYGYRRKVVYPPGRERVLESGVPKATDEKVVLTPHTDEAKHIVEIFERYASGEHSIRSLAEWLGSVSPGYSWQAPAIRYALANPAYAGDVVFGRVPADDHDRSVCPTRDDADLYVKHDAHPALVDRTLFERVQELLGRNRRMKRGVRTTWVLSGILQCRCGAALVAGNSDRPESSHVASYRCSTQGKTKARRCPFPGSVSKPAIERAVIQAIVKETSSSSARARILSFLDDAIANASSPSADRLANLQKERREIVQRRERLVRAIEEGVDRGDVRGRLEQLRANEARLANQIAAVSSGAGANSRERMRAERDRIAAMLSDLPSLFARLSGPALRELIRPWIERATFNTENRVLRLEIRHMPTLLSAPHHVHAADASASRARTAASRNVTVRLIVIPRRVA